MPFQIIRNDIIGVEADAIVNTADPEPMVGGGTDWAVHTAAGPALIEARRAIGPIGIGQAAATPAFGLPAKYVLHTVGPVWIDGAHGEEEQLRAAYDAALALALELGCRSVAFPLMAAGSCGFPHEIALSVALRAFTDFLLEHEMQIYLVLFNARAFGAAGALFGELKSYIDDRYVAERTEEEYFADDQTQLFRRERRRNARGPRRIRESDAAGESVCIDASRPLGAAPARPAPQAASLEDVLRRQQESSFTEYLLDLLKERGGKDSEVYKRAEISRQLFSKILNKRDYQPTKSTVLQLAIGLQLDLAQTQKLLERAGFSLTRSSRRDLAVQYFIERRIYSVTVINEALLDLGLPLLTTGMKA